MNVLPKPTFAPIVLRCGVCPDEVWTDWMPNHVPFDVAIAAMKAFCCPACGRAEKILIVVETEAEQ